MKSPNRLTKALIASSALTGTLAGHKLLQPDALTYGSALEALLMFGGAIAAVALAHRTDKAEITSSTAQSISASDRHL